MAQKVGTELKTIIVTDADAEKLLKILDENAEYRPDYFGSLKDDILSQLLEQERQVLRQLQSERRELQAQLPPHKEECSQ